jgi:hypothetical protein
LSVLRKTLPDCWCVPIISETDLPSCKENAALALWVAAHHLRLTERVIQSSIDEIDPACFLSAEAYDKLTSDMISAKDRLTRLLTAKDKKATVSGLVGVDRMFELEVERIYALRMTLIHLSGLSAFAS